MSAARLISHCALLLYDTELKPKWQIMWRAKPLVLINYNNIIVLYDRRTRGNGSGGRLDRHNALDITLGDPPVYYMRAIYTSPCLYKVYSTVKRPSDVTHVTNAIFQERPKYVNNCFVKNDLRWCIFLYRFYTKKLFKDYITSWEERVFISVYHSWSYNLYILTVWFIHIGQIFRILLVFIGFNICIRHLCSSTIW